jgi:Flp pilus assembly protein TadG
MIRSFQISLRNFKQDRRGVSAVEFALLAPFMITLYLGGVELSDGIGIDRKVTLTTGAMANLAAQASSISSAGMADMFKASTSIMSPYSTGPLQISISCIAIDNNKVARVKWSEVSGGASKKTGTITVPGALSVANTQLLYSEVTYTYTPIFAHIITGTLTLSDKMYMSPRISAPTYGTTACT